MKKIIAVIFTVLILLITSCKNGTPTGSPEVIRGSGNLVTELRSVGSFHSVDLTAVGNVNITFDPGQQVSVTVDDNIMEYITTMVSGGTLTIGVEPGISVTHLNLTVDLTMTDLEELTLTGWFTEHLKQFRQRFFIEIFGKSKTVTTSF